ALEVDFRTAKLARQTLGEIERTRPAGIMCVEVLELRLECRIFLGRLVGLLELENERHQGFGDIAAAELAEMAAFVGSGTIGVQSIHRDIPFARADLAATAAG